ncbi:hypothetical protein DFJ77DRAFT_14890 [Powellomyces hirtus]|nr:hypothetical protein DFJ77DRAFT_14890 [Powellomyces hirtus]
MDNSEGQSATATATATKSTDVLPTANQINDGQKTPLQPRALSYAEMAPRDSITELGSESAEVPQIGGIVDRDPLATNTTSSVDSSENQQKDDSHQAVSLVEKKEATEPAVVHANVWVLGTDADILQPILSAPTEPDITPPVPPEVTLPVLSEESTDTSSQGNKIDSEKEQSLPTVVSPDPNVEADTTHDDSIPAARVLSVAEGEIPTSELVAEKDTEPVMEPITASDAEPFSETAVQVALDTAVSAVSETAVQVDSDTVAEVAAEIAAESAAEVIAEPVEEIAAPSETSPVPPPTSPDPAITDLSEPENKLETPNERSEVGRDSTTASLEGESDELPPVPEPAGDGTAIASEARPSEARPSEARPSEARPSETRPSETRPSETRPSETRTAQKGMSLRVIEAHTPGDDTELAIDVGDVVDLDLTPASSEEHWWYGTNRSWGPHNGVQGYFPAKCVVVESWDINTSTVTAPTADQSDQEDGPTATGGDALVSDSEQEDAAAEVSDEVPEEEEPLWTAPVGSKVIVKNEYHKAKADELDLEVGDLIVVMEAPEGGWWRGMKNLGGKQPLSGWFPAIMVRPEEIFARPEKSTANNHNELIANQAASAEEREQEEGMGDKRKSWFHKRMTIKKPDSKGFIGNGSATAASAGQKKKSRTRSMSAPIPHACSTSSSLIDGLSADALGLSVVTEGSGDLDVFANASEDAASRSRHNSLPRNSRSRSQPPNPYVPDANNSGASTAPSSKGMNRLSTFLSGKSNQSRLSLFAPSRSTLSESSFDSSVATFARGSPAINIDDLMVVQNERWQDRVSPEVIQSMSHRAQQRMTAIFEFIATERDYVRDLKIIIGIFMKPMTEKKVVSPKVIGQLFSNIEQLLVVNQEFLSALEDLYNGNPIIERFGDFLSTSMDRLVSYTPYCSRQAVSGAKHLSLMQSKKEYRVFLEESYKHPLTRRLDLGGFLIKPVQRICKYPLLIREIIKYTDETSEDFEPLKGAAERISGIIAMVNAGTKMSEGGVRKMAEIQHEFGDKTNLLGNNPSRHLLREDAVFVSAPPDDVKKPRQLFMFNDSLLCAKKDWRDKWHTVAQASFKECLVADVRDKITDKATNLIEIEFPADGPIRGASVDRYLVQLSTTSVKTGWVDTYRRASLPFGVTIKTKHQTSAGLMTLSGAPAASTTTVLATGGGDGEESDGGSDALRVELAKAVLQAAEAVEMRELERVRADEAQATVDRLLAQVAELQTELASTRAECAAQREEREKLVAAWEVERRVLAAEQEQISSRLRESEIAVAAERQHVSDLQEQNAVLSVTVEQGRATAESRGRETELVRGDLTAVTRLFEKAQETLAGVQARFSEAQVVHSETVAGLQQKFQEAQVALGERDVDRTRLQFECNRMQQNLTRAQGAAENAEKEHRATVGKLKKILEERDRALAGKTAEIAEMTRRMGEAAEKFAAAEREAVKIKSEQAERVKTGEEAVGRLNAELAKVKKDRAREQQQFSDSERARRDLQRQLETGRAQYKQLGDANRQLAAEHAKQKHTLSENKVQIRLFGQDRQALDSKIAELTDQLATSNKALESARAAAEVSRDTIRKLHEEVHRITLRAERAEEKVAPMERYRVNVTRLTDENKELKAKQQEELAKVKRDADEIRRRLEDAERDERDASKVVERVEREKSKLEKEKELLESSITMWKKENAALEKDKAVLEADKNGLEKEEARLKREFATKADELSASAKEEARLKDKVKALKREHRHNAAEQMEHFRRLSFAHEELQRRCMHAERLCEIGQEELRLAHAQIATLQGRANAAGEAESKCVELQEELLQTRDAARAAETEMERISTSSAKNNKELASLKAAFADIGRAVTLSAQIHAATAASSTSRLSLSTGLEGGGGPTVAASSPVLPRSTSSVLPRAFSSSAIPSHHASSCLGQPFRSAAGAVISKQQQTQHELLTALHDGYENQDGSSFIADKVFASADKSGAHNVLAIVARIHDLILENDHGKTELEAALMKIEELEEQRDVAVLEAADIKTAYDKISAKWKSRADGIRANCDRLKETVETKTLENATLSRQISEQTERLEKQDRERRDTEVKMQKLVATMRSHKATFDRTIADFQARTIKFTQDYEHLCAVKNEAIQRAQEYRARMREAESERNHLLHLTTSLREVKQKTEALLEGANETAKAMAGEIARTKKMREDRPPLDGGRAYGDSADVLKFLVAAASNDVREAARRRGMSPKRAPEVAAM